MSLAARRLARLERTLCRCRRRAVFVSPSSGRVVRRDDHDQCPGCWRRAMDRTRGVRAPVMHGVAHRLA